MAKDKNKEEEYRAEGRRRMDERKEKRRNKYFSLISKARDIGYFVPISAVRNGGVWPDSNSPTGYSQVCDWRGICQAPCNGDC